MAKSDFDIVDLEEAQATPVVEQQPTSVSDFDAVTFDELSDLSPQIFQDIGRANVQNAMHKTNPLTNFIDLTVDRTTGLQDAGIRAKVQGFADRPSEQDMVLEPIFGKNGFYRENSGAMIIQPDALEKAGLETRTGKLRGTPLQLDALPFTGGISELGMDVGPDMIGDTAEIVTPLITTLMTKGSGPAAATARAALATIFTTVGKFSQEQLEHFAGLNNQEFGEVALDALESGLLAGAGEGVISAGTPVARKALGPNTTRTKAPLGQEGELKSTVDPERLEMIDRVRGNLQAEPSIKKQVGGSGVNIAGGEQQLVENALLKTERQQGVNRAVAQAGEDIVEEVRPGIPEATAKNFNVAIDSRISKTAQAHKRDIKRISNSIKKELVEVESRLDSLGGASGGLGEEFKEVLGEGFDAFKGEASALYKGIDLVEGRAVVPTKALRKARDEIVNKLKVNTTDELGNTVSALPATLHEDTVKLLKLMDQIAPSNGKTPLQTFEAMQSIRSQLRKLAYSDDVLRDFGQANAAKLDQAITDSMANARKGLSVKAFRALERADQFYADNIGKFDEVLFKRLTKNIRANGSIPAETAPMVQALIKSKSYNKVSGILKLVKENKPEMLKEIRKADMDLMLEDSLLSNGGINYRKLQAQIANRSKGKNGDLFGLVHGDDAKKIKGMVDELVAKDANIGKIDITDPLSVMDNQGLVKLEEITKEVPTGNIKELLKEAVGVVRQRDVTYQNFDILMKHLRQGGDNFKNASSFLLAHNNPNALRQAKRLLGETSDEWKQLQQIGRRKLVDRLSKIKDDPLEIYTQGADLKKALLADKATNLELFGKDGFKRLLDFAEEAQFASTQGSFGGIVAASIRARPVHNLGKILKFVVIDVMLQRLSAADYFTRGLLVGAKGKKVRKASEFAARAFAQTFASQLDNAYSTTIKTIGENKKPEDFGEIELDLGEILEDN